MNIAPWNGELEIVEGEHMKNFDLTYYKRVVHQKETIPQSSDNNEIGEQLLVWEDWVSCYPFEDMYVHPAFQRQNRVVSKFKFSRFDGCVFDKSANDYLYNDEQVANFNEDMGCHFEIFKEKHLITRLCRKLNGFTCFNIIS